jgi:ABC-type lipoprotein release transport system permease subunit
VRPEGGTVTIFTKPVVAIIFGAFIFWSDIAIGVAAAAATARLLQSVLFGVSSYDPVAFVGAPVLMLAVAAAAAIVPTHRAMRVNPMSALRSE